MKEEKRHPFEGGLSRTAGLTQPQARQSNSEASSHAAWGSEAGFGRAFDQAAIGMALVGLDGRWLRVNPALCKIVGYSEQELLVTDFQTITHPEDLDGDLNYVQQMLNQKIRSYQMEKRYLHKAGQVVWVLLSVSLVCGSDNKGLFFFSQIQHITEGKRAEEALRESEKRVRAILDNSPNLIFLKDVEGRYLVVNREFERALSVSQEQIEGRRDDEVFPPMQAAAFRANDLQVINGGVKMEFEEIALQEDGPHTSIVQKFPLFDAGAKIYAIGGIVTDITGRKRVEEALRRSEARYRELLENTPYGVYHATWDGRFIDVNPALVSMLGYPSKEELMAVNLATGVYHSPDDRAQLIEADRGLLKPSFGSGLRAKQRCRSR